MKKIGAIALGLVICGALFANSDIYANKDLTKVLDINKTNHSKSLEVLGIKADTSKLKNLDTVTDNNGKKWIYNTFTQSNLIEEKMEQKYSKETVSSFIEVQDQIMQALAKKGDTVPVILLNEELTEGTFTFIRDKGKGKVVAVKLKYNEKDSTWNYKE
ncbi:hypothetical protein [Brevibacillus sp. SYSU BS000544]|uniref:hypothetical protein n=1 Tax=Brevibacillus sp. SYSU BS000544 TaxID=3416443 RepID=UPI003CE4AA41